MHRILLAAAAACAVLVAAPAVADEQRYEVRIVYGDLDLTTQAGADQMLDRIRLAADDVCEAPGSLVLRLREQACVDDFTRRALGELNRAVPERAYARHEPGATFMVSAR